MLLSLLSMIACTSTGGLDSADLAEDSGAYGAGEIEETVLSFSGERPKNVLMIAMDTTRKDRIGFYSAENETPFLDEMMGQGFVLDQHHSCSNWTFDSVICTQSGRSAPDLGLLPTASGSSLNPIPDEIPLYSEFLTNNLGYQSGLATAQWMMSDSLNTAQGFQQIWLDAAAPAADVSAAGLEILDSFDADSPWYLHLHFLDPHASYDPPPSYLDELEGLPSIPYDLSSVAGWERLQEDWDTLSHKTQETILEQVDIRYNAEIRYLDDQLALLFEELEARGALDDTLVVFWVDHGEQLYDHGQPDHGSSMFNEEISVLSFFWARGLESGVWELPTSHVDIWPTILSALEIPSEAEVDGVPVGGAGLERPLFTHKARSAETQQAVLYHDRKLIYDWTGDFELYELDVDPDERSPITDPENEDVEALWALLQPKIDEIELLNDVAPEDPGINW